MDQLGILVMLRARPGKENDVEAFLASAQPPVQAETQTTSWFAVRLDESRYGIFDTFPDQAGRDAHFKGQIASLLFARAEELFSEPPEIQLFDILALKMPALE